MIVNSHCDLFPPPNNVYMLMNGRHSVHINIGVRLRRRDTDTRVTHLSIMKPKNWKYIHDSAKWVIFVFCFGCVQYCYPILRASTNIDMCVFFVRLSEQITGLLCMPIAVFSLSTWSFTNNDISPKLIFFFAFRIWNNSDTVQCSKEFQMSSLLTNTYFR